MPSTVNDNQLRSLAPNISTLRKQHGLTKTCIPKQRAAARLHPCSGS